MSIPLPLTTVCSFALHMHHTFCWVLFVVGCILQTYVLSCSLSIQGLTGGIFAGGVPQLRKTGLKGSSTMLSTCIESSFSSSRRYDELTPFILASSGGASGGGAPKPKPGPPGPGGLRSSGGGGAPKPKPGPPGGLRSSGGPPGPGGLRSSGGGGIKPPVGTSNLYMLQHYHATKG